MDRRLQDWRPAIRETYPAELGRREVEALERQRRAEVEAQGIGPADSWSALAARYWQEHERHLAWQDSIKGHLEALSDLIGDRTPARSIHAAGPATRGLPAAPDRRTLRLD